jgi:hypothetical protein
MMGLLGSIFSAGDSAKRQIRGLLDDPIGVLQQKIGHINDGARVANELTGDAAQERMTNVNGPANVALQNYLSERVNPLAMVTWHASPHKFARFDSSKIGDGEGAQIYGHGLYLAESPEVSGVGGKYFQQFQNHPATRKSGGPYAYKVDLPDDQIAKMLDWDKPLSQQPKEVREALTAIARGDEQVMRQFRDLGPNAPANQAYAALTQQAVRLKKYERMRAGIPETEAVPSLVYGQDVASRQLRQAGIPGIRYLDGDSRGVGQGTSNFVVFPGNEDMLKILEINGKSLLNP